VARRTGITAAGRRRVDAALERSGMVLVQGQADIESIADLLAGRPVTTRGYSWDYEPAWRLTYEYEQRDDIAVVKLFRGRRTLVTRRLWPAVDALAGAARARVHARVRTDRHRRLLVAVEEDPGAALSHVRERLALDRRVCDRTRRDLEQWLCLFGRERTDVEYHTHEPALFPWRDGVIARTCRSRRPLDADDALEQLCAAAGVPARAFPVARIGAGQIGGGVGAGDGGS
jgi:hypothetical protein